MKKLSTFIAGTVFGIVLATASVAGASTYLKATQLTIKVYVDGKEAKLSEKPISVNGRSYLPVRDTANALGYSVASATGSKIELVQGGVSINSSSTPSTSQTTTTKNETTSTKIGGSKVANLEQTYAKGDKLDAERISADIASGKIDLNVQDASNGKSLMMLVIEKDDFETYKVIRKNVLNPNLQDSNGNTALHYAALNSAVFYVGALQDINANPNIKNNEGKLPIDLANESNGDRASLKGYMIRYK